MFENAIIVENLSKQYQIGHISQRSDTLRDALVNAGRRLSSGLKSQLNEQRLIWALRDISFEIPYGQVVGVIGRNGAGKSTLLKILSQITEPTTGRALINGRVGSLLEVGTGFHPELTGRENIYLYGAILGMGRLEIKQKFDEIVDFAEIQKFLDTPVKRYSSGMYVRLAFAVAAHLEPEILLVDEVLAVGDTEFQKRCLGKMDNVASSGRTVLFVSHNLNIIQRLCPKTILLNQARLVEYSNTSSVITKYINSGMAIEAPESWIDLQNKRSIESQKPHFTHFWYSANSKTSGNHPIPHGSIQFRVRVYSDTNHTVNSLAVTLYDQNGTKLVNADTLSQGAQLSLDPGMNEFCISIDHLFLNPGIYNVGLWMANPPVFVYDRVDNAAKLEVIDITTVGPGRRPLEDGVVVNQFSVEKIKM